MKTNTFTRMRTLSCWSVNALIAFNLLGGGCGVNADKGHDGHDEIGYCTDSHDEIESVWSRNQGGWVEGITCADTQYCDDSDQMKRYCPVACLSCPKTCVDQINPIRWQLKFTECADAHNEKNILCRDYNFAYRCPITCDFCPRETDDHPHPHPIDPHPIDPHPHPHPTQNPHEPTHPHNPDCSDKENSFIISERDHDGAWQDVSANCADVEDEDHFGLCEHHTFQENCPYACKICGDGICRDRTDEVAINGILENCDAKTKHGWGSNLCKNFQYAKHCPFTCDFCPLDDIGHWEENCVDSEDEFITSRRQEYSGKWEYVEETCNSAEDRHSYLCSTNQFRRRCPATCDSCPKTCEDDHLSAVRVHGDLQKCTDVDDDLEYPWKDPLCGNYGFAKHCPGTCSFCPDDESKPVPMFCEDMGSDFGDADHPDNCDIDESKEFGYCKESKYKRNCPATCDTCPETCNDKKGAVPGVGDTCDDAADFRDTLCHSFEFATHCTRKCGFCPEHDYYKISGEYCVDSVDEIIIDVEKDGEIEHVIETCESIGEKGQFRFCNEEQVKRSCPTLCHTCPDECVDKNTHMRVHGNIRECHHAKNWKDYLCQDMDFATNCAETCHFCPIDDTPPEHPEPQGEYCADSNSDFIVHIPDDDGGQDEMKSCRSAEDEPDLCDNLQFKRRCATTCETCPAKCEDSHEHIKIGRDDVSCSDAHWNWEHDLCHIYSFAKHCANTCHFCKRKTDSQKFVLEKTEHGHDNNGYFGSNTAMSTGGDQVIVTEISNGNTFIYAYNHHTHSTTKIKMIKYGGRFTDLAASKDGKNLIFAYEFSGNEGKFFIARQTNWNWIDRGTIDFEGGDKFGFVVDISDDGNTVMIADKTNVYFFENRSRSGTEWTLRGNGDGISFLGNQKKQQIMDVSMTGNARTVAVSLKSPNIIRVFKWRAPLENWRKSGAIRRKNKDDPDFEDPVLTIELTANGKTLFAGKPQENKNLGIIRVYEFNKVKKRNNGSKWQRWQLWQGQNGIVLEGEQEGKEGKDGVGERLGKRISVSHDGKTVAWGSEVRAGIVRWNGSEWLDQRIEVKGNEPTVALDANGEWCAVGLPFAGKKSDKWGERDLQRVGELQIFQAEKTHHSSSSSRSWTKSSVSSKSSKSYYSQKWTKDTKRG